MKTIALVEKLDLSEAELDNEARVIRNVVLISAGRSANNRLYPEAVLEKAASIFEASKAYADHGRKPGESRSVRDITGWYSNVRYAEGKLRADRHFAPTQAGNDVWALAQAVIEGRAPTSLAGLSINAVGQGKVKQFEGRDVLEVESIDRAISVDDVDTPAAGGTYLTASSGDELLNSLFQAMSFEEWFAARPEYMERVHKELKTVRQDDALKAAKAEAEQTRQTLVDAQSLAATLTKERDAAMLEVQQARRDLAMEKAFRSAGLPAKVEADLRERLVDAAPDQWVSIIQKERDKLKSLGLLPRPAVTGSQQQVHTPAAAPKTDPLASARQRLAEVSSPEELQRIQQQLSIGGQS